MPEWEEFYFRKFFLNGYLICISKMIRILAFYCVNTSYPMDNCFTGRRDRSRQTTEKVILYKIPAGPVRVYIRQVSPRAYFLSSQNDVIASFFVWRTSVRTCFSTVIGTFEVLKTTFFIELYLKLYILNLLLECYGVPWTEKRDLWPRYGFIRHTHEVCTLS